MVRLFSKCWRTFSNEYNWLPECHFTRHSIVPIIVHALRHERCLSTTQYRSCYIKATTDTPIRKETRLSQNKHDADEDWNSYDDFFRFTRGRFVSNESEQMSKRYVRFDMNRLSQIAAESVGAEKCISIEKYPDGQYNKAFVITMDNSREVVAKVPNPNAGLPHFTTASEVATMSFVRDVLKTPAPKVITWSSRAENNEVGAEYIIMEKVEGVPLRLVWGKLDPRQKLPIIQQVVKWYRAWLSIRFLYSGCLYFADDLNDAKAQDYLYITTDGQKVRNKRYKMGPSVEREWCDDGRASLSCDRGPWLNASKVRRAIAHREVLASKILPFPTQLTMLCGPGLYMPKTSKKVAALESYLQVVDSLLPLDEDITAFHLWHRDLHDDNIFVDPTDPSKITGVIDWQSVGVTSLMDNCPDPAFLGYSGPELQKLEPPAWPDTSHMSKDEEDRAIEQHEHYSVFVAFRMLLERRAPVVHKSVLFQRTAAHRIMLISRRIFEVGEAYLHSCIVDLEEDWTGLPRIKGGQREEIVRIGYPLILTQSEIESIEQDVIDSERAVEAMNRLKKELGDLWPDKGATSHEDYGKVKQQLHALKKDAINRFAKSEQDKKVWEQYYWPFDD